MSGIVNKIKSLCKKKRSVVFYRQSYYHFYYLAKALRDRGWDAICVNLEEPQGENAKFYHGEDVNLYAACPEQFHSNIEFFFKKAKKRFKLFHFAGDGILCFFPENYCQEDPADIIEWRKLGNKVAYSVSGCNSATAQSSVKQWSALDGGKSVCHICPWEHCPDICSDEKNLAQGKKLEKYCDIIFAETLPALDYIALHPWVIREPLTMCLDPDFWQPNLKVPEDFKVPKEDNEIFVYHAVGNYHSRTKNGRNIKGTHAVIAAIEQLKNEGFPVKLIFVTDMKNTEVRFMQAQADIIVDQLNMGRYGATAREGMMLGKPVICYINSKELTPHEKLKSLREVPLVSATEETVYDALKDLILNPEKRQAIGKASREYALYWHSMDKCAERYEQVYDALMKKDHRYLGEGIV